MKSKKSSKMKAKKTSQATKKKETKELDNSKKVVKMTKATKKEIKTKDKTFNKKILIIGGVIFLIIIVVVIILIIKKPSSATKLNNEDMAKGQDEVVKVVQEYVKNRDDIVEYAKVNSKLEFSIKELRGIFDIDTKNFTELKYHCKEDTTYIRYNDDYKDYVIILDCEDFYLN